jgi:hypothetical protein
MSNEELNAQITSLKAEVKKWKKLTGLTTEVMAEAEDEKIILGRKIIDLEEKITELEDREITVYEEGALKAHELTVKNEALEFENINLKNQLEKSQLKSHIYYNKYILSNHRAITGDLRDEGMTLLDAECNGVFYRSEVVELYTDDEDIRKAEDLIRKRLGLLTFHEEWKEREGLDFPKYYEGNCIIGEDDE